MTSTANFNHSSYTYIFRHLNKCYPLLDTTLCISRFLPAKKPSSDGASGRFGDFADYLKAKLFLRKTAIKLQYLF